MNEIDTYIKIYTQIEISRMRQVTMKKAKAFLALSVMPLLGCQSFLFIISEMSVVGKSNGRPIVSGPFCSVISLVILSCLLILFVVILLLKSISSGEIPFRGVNFRPLLQSSRKKNIKNWTKNYNHTIIMRITSVVISKGNRSGWRKNCLHYKSRMRNFSWDKGRANFVLYPVCM